MNIIRSLFLFLFLLFGIECNIIVAPLTGHIGSNDTELTPNHLNAIQTQMQSKGGYDMNSIRIQV